MKTITQKEEQHAAACCSEPKNRYICISEESEGACTDTLFETLPNLEIPQKLLPLLMEFDASINPIQRGKRISKIRTQGLDLRENWQVKRSDKTYNTSLHAIYQHKT